jgi:2-iminobutanoate/2-iminopropanoate deaminase
MANQVPLSPSVTCNGFIFLSGQIYLTPEGKLLEGTIEEQVHQIMKNLKGVLNNQGVDFENVVKSTIYLTDMSLYKTVSDIYGSYFEGSYPAREAVCVKELPLGAKVEISMIAHKYN